MRKVTREVVGAFLARKSKTVGNTRTDGESLYLFGHEIAYHINSTSDRISISSCNWHTNTTKDRLNGLLELAGTGKQIFQKDFVWLVYDQRNDVTKPFYNGMVI